MPEKQFLVMPIAKAGDLSGPEQVRLYEYELDGVLQVAEQLASALAAAHSAGIIHRDVKPENILFTCNGHEVWLSDFGICLIRESPRITDEGEIVGPRAFMAPELEDGGSLPVTPAADIYSLGKVIFFMLTGGTFLPRERLHDEPFNQAFSKGGRFRLLGLLLDKMICGIATRMPDMQSVIQALGQIKSWEEDSRRLSLSQSALAGIERLQMRAAEAERVANENALAGDQETRTLAAVNDSILSWLRTELLNVASHIGAGGVLLCQVHDDGVPSKGEFDLDRGDNLTYVGLGCVELTIEKTVDRGLGRKDILQLRLLQEDPSKYSAATGTRGGIPRPARDSQLAFLPFYRRTFEHHNPRMSAEMGYLTKKAIVGSTVANIGPPDRDGPPVHITRAGPICDSFAPALCQCLGFRASEWPHNTDQLKTSLSEALETFIDFVQSGATATGC